MRGRLRGALTKLALAAGAGFVIWRAFFSPAEEAPAAAPLTETVVLGDVEETVLAHGVLEPLRMVNVGAQVSGQVTALHAELGQSVKAGDLLAKIDAIQQSNSLRVAEAALADVRAQRRGREAQLRQTERAYERQKFLMGRSLAALSALETAEAAYLSLAAEVEALDAQIVQAEVQLENARANLGYTRVRAPMDGVVVSIVTKAGQTLNANQQAPTIVVLAQLDVMTVKIRISEADVGRVRVGQPARFTIMSAPEARFAAVLDQIEPAPSGIGEKRPGEAGAAQTANAAVYYNGLLSTPNSEGRLRMELANLRNPAELAREISKRLGTLARSRSFVDWSGARGLAEDLETQRKALVEKLSPSAPAEALELLWRLLVLAGPTYERCDDSSDLIGSVFAQTRSDLGPVALAAKANPEGLADQAFAALCDNDYAHDRLIPVLAPALGAAGLERLKARLSEEVARAPPGAGRENARRRGRRSGLGAGDAAATGSRTGAACFMDSPPTTPELFTSSERPAGPRR